MPCLWVIGPHQFTVYHPDPHCKEKGQDLANGSNCSPPHKWSPIPLHPTVSNSYVILGEIPASANWFIVLHLKDAVLCIPLAKESQYLFPFKWEAPEEKHEMMTWTVLPQGFRDSIYLFGQDLSHDLQDLDLGSNGKILQYVGDLLICSRDEEKCPITCNSGSKLSGRKGI